MKRHKIIAMPASIKFGTKSGLIFYGAMKILFIALFSLSLIYASNASAGDEIVCQGKDMIAGLAKTNPDELVKLRLQAVKTVYGNSRLWKISKPGTPDSWLFGTMHMADKRVSTLPRAARVAFENSNTVLVEITDMLNAKKAQTTLLSLKHLTFRLDGTTIESDISLGQMEKLKAAIKARALPYELAIRMQPWMLAPAIGMQLCEIIAKKRGQLFLDARIMNLALQEGKQLVALETTREQLTAIASMPREFQITALVEVLELGDKLGDIKQTMKNLYINGEIAMIVPLIRHASKKFASGAGFDEFQEKLVVQRNLKMARRAQTHFAKGNVFMAVGALHLPGKSGLVALLKNSGYNVQAIDTPVFTD